MGGRQKDRPCDPSPWPWARAPDFPVSGKAPSMRTPGPFCPRETMEGYKSVPTDPPPHHGSKKGEGQTRGSESRGSGGSGVLLDYTPDPI